MGERALKRLGAWIALMAMPCLTWGLIVTAHEAANPLSGHVAIEAVVTVGFSVFGALITGYLSLVSATAALVAPWGGARATSAVTRLAPSAWRRITATAVGVTLASSASLPALAQPDATSPVDWAPHDHIAVALEAADPSTAELDASLIPTAEDPPVEPTSSPTPLNPPVAPTSSPTPLNPPSEEAVPATSSPVIDPFAIIPGGGQVGDASATPAEPPVPELPRGTQSHVVVRGESLWSIAAGVLGEDASTADIANAWPLLYAANADLIGDDPGLIYVGQELTIPGGLR